MPLDLSAYDIELGDTRDLVEKLNNAHRAIEAGVNATEDTVTDRLDDQDAIIDGLAGAMTAGVTFKGTHSAAGGSYPAGPANGDYWIISAAGTISGVYFNVGDSIVYYSSSWIRIPATPDMSAINPLAKAIRVAITGDNGSSAVMRAANDAEFNPGNGGFTIAHMVVPGGYVGSSGTRHNSINNAAGSSVNLPILFFALSGGNVTPNLYINTVQFAASTTLTSAQFLLGGEWAVTYSPPTTLAAGAVVFYRNGVKFGAPVTVPAGTPHTFTGSDLILEATAGTREPCSWQYTRFFTRTLSSAEVALNYNDGPSAADRGASQTPIYASNFSGGVDSWGVATMTITGNNDGIGGVDNCAFAACTTTGTATNVRIARGTVIPLVDKYCTMKISIYRPASNATVVGFELADTNGSTIFASASKAITTAADTWQEFTFSGKVTSTSGSQSLRLYPINAAGTRAQASGEGLYFVSVSSVHNGLTAEWMASNAQSNTGQVLDTSGNKTHLILPSAGARILPHPPRTFQVRSTHSWAETHELQYLTGVNQSVVPSTAKLVRIFGEVSSTGGSGPQDFTIGDGSDGDRYVVLTSGLTTGKKEFTIDTTYAGFNDGTNLKLTIDPDANCTMTVALVLVFETLE